MVSPFFKVRHNFTRHPQTACPYVVTRLVAGITATMVISFAKPNELIAAKNSAKVVIFFILINNLYVILNYIFRLIGMMLNINRFRIYSLYKNNDFR